MAIDSLASEVSLIIDKIRDTANLLKDQPSEELARVEHEMLIELSGVKLKLSNILTNVSL